MKRWMIHLVGYTLVAAASFLGGAVTRDYLVTKEARAERGRYAKFLRQPAPPLASTTLESVPWSLDDQRGKVVVIEIWSTWCAPCVAEVPQLKRIHDRFGARSDFALIGVSLDKDIETVKRFCAEREMTWTQLLEPGKEFESRIARALEVKAIPFTCVVDKRGVVRVYRHSSNLERDIERLLEEPGETS